MITYKKLSIEEIRTAFTSGIALMVKKWQVFQNKEHSTRTWVLIFALAMIFGMTGKAIAIKTFTIGYEDYLVSKVSSEIEPLKASAITRGPICEE